MTDSPPHTTKTAPMLKREPIRKLCHIVDGEKVSGPHEDLHNAHERLYGDCTDITGNVSGLSGNVSSLRGNVSGLSGNLNLIPKSERPAKISDYIVEEGQ